MTTRTATLPRNPVKIELHTTPAANPPQIGSATQNVSAAADPAPARPAEYNAAPAPIPAWRKGAPWAIAFLVCCAWDRAVWLMATRPSVSGRVPKLQWLEDSFAGQNLWATLRAAAHLDFHALGQASIALPYGAAYFFGRLWVWIGLAVFFIFRHWGGTDGARVRDGLRRGVFVFLVPALAGLGAELLKFIVRRERPEEADGMYAFLQWPRVAPTDPAFWKTEHLGLASSHAAVAVGGALAAGLLLPRWRAVLYVIAGLCTLSRIAVGAHFLSDAFAGIALAFAAYHVVYAWDRRNNGGMGLRRTALRGTGFRGTGLPARVSGASPEVLISSPPEVHGV